MNGLAVLIWLVGGVALYDAARRLAEGKGGADPQGRRWRISPVGLAALGFHMLFLLRIAPDNNLTVARAAAAALLVAALEGLVLWRTGPAWKWSCLAGTVPLLMFASSGWESLAGIAPSLLISPRFYFQWSGQLNHLFDLVVIVLALAGVLIGPAKGRTAGLALWSGYIVFGLVFPQRVITGLQLVMVPVVALSLAFLVEVFLARRPFPNPPVPVRLPFKLAMGVVFILALAGGLRLIGVQSISLTGARPLHSAIIARGIYYAITPAENLDLRQAAVSLWHGEEVYEPPILEGLVALGYRLTGGIHLWVPRLLAVLFSLVSGLAIFDLARQMAAGSMVAAGWGALTVMVYYLLSPYGVTQSRSFQPDLFMVMWIILAANVAYRWTRLQTWPWTILMGLTGGVAILVKVMAVFPVACLVGFLVLASGGLWKALRNLKVWVAFILMAVIPALYYLVLIPSRSSGFFEFWTVSMLRLLLQPGFYTAWFGLIETLYGLPVLVLALVGVWFSTGKSRMLLLGLWLGYILFTAVFPFQVSTHDYYNLMLIPILGLSLLPLAVKISARFLSSVRPVQIAFIGLALAALVYSAWLTRNTMVTSNGPPAVFEAPAWLKIGQALPTDGATIALTHEDGKRLKYFGWRVVALWPAQSDFSLTLARGGNLAMDFQSEFARLTAGYRYFLVTEFGELQNQPDLRLQLKDHYAIASQGEGYILYDLGQSK